MVLSHRIGDTTGVSWLLTAKVAVDVGAIVAFEIEEAPGDVEGIVQEASLKRDAKATGDGGGEYGYWLGVICYWGGVEKAEGRKSKVEGLKVEGRRSNEDQVAGSPADEVSGTGVKEMRDKG